MSFELIAAEEAHYPKALMCRALGLSRSGHHSGADGERLGQDELSAQLLARGHFQPAEQGCRRIEGCRRRPDDGLAGVEREILDANLDHRPCAARARRYAAAASAGRPRRSSTTPILISGRSFCGSSCAAAS